MNFPYLITAIQELFNNRPMNMCTLPYQPSEYIIKLQSIDLTIKRDGVHTLRDYQIKGKKDIYKQWLTHRSVLFQMPTGTGKTLLFTSLMRDIFNVYANNGKAVKILVIAHREELIKQIDDSLIKFEIRHGIIQSTIKNDKVAQVQIASVSTLKNRLDEWKQQFEFDFIIIDEAHHAMANSYLNICNTWPASNILGVTATPCRLDGKGLCDIFDELITTDPVYKFIEKKWLSDYDYYSIKLNSPIQNKINNITDIVGGDYSEKAMMGIMDNSTIYADLIKSYETYAKGKKGIIYAITKAHCKKIVDQFKCKNYKIERIDSDTDIKERRRIVSDFRSGKIEILCNVNIFTEGFDCPDVEFIMLARPTLSLSLYLQQVGRGLRNPTGEKKAIFIDAVGLFNRFGLPSAKRQWHRHYQGNPELEDDGVANSPNENEPRSFCRNITQRDDELELVYSSYTSTSEVHCTSDGEISLDYLITVDENDKRGLLFRSNQIFANIFDILEIFQDKDIITAIGYKDRQATLFQLSNGKSYELLSKVKSIDPPHKENPYTYEYNVVRYIGNSNIPFNDKYVLILEPGGWKSYKFIGKANLNDRTTIYYAAKWILYQNRIVYATKNGAIHHLGNNVFLCCEAQSNNSVIYVNKNSVETEAVSFYMHDKNRDFPNLSIVRIAGGPYGIIYIDSVNKLHEVLPLKYRFIEHDKDTCYIIADRTSKRPRDISQKIKNIESLITE